MLHKEVVAAEAYFYPLRSNDHRHTITEKAIKSLCLGTKEPCLRHFSWSSLFAGSFVWLRTHFFYKYAELKLNFSLHRNTFGWSYLEWKRSRVLLQSFAMHKKKIGKWIKLFFTGLISQVLVMTMNGSWCRGKIRWRSKDSFRKSDSLDI